MAGRETCALVHYAQRCSVSDVMPLISGGMGHRFPIVSRLTAEQSQRRQDINIVATCAVDRGGDDYCHRFGEGNVLWFKCEHRAYSHPVFKVVKWFVGRLNLKQDKNKDCYLSPRRVLELQGVVNWDDNYLIIRPDEVRNMWVVWSTNREISTICFLIYFERSLII